MVSSGEGVAGCRFAVLCMLKHEDGVVNLEGGTKLDTHNLDYVALRQQQEGLSIDLLPKKHRIQLNYNSSMDSQSD